MLKNKQFLIFYKLFFALLGFSAIITEIAVINERGVFVPANFFSFFTIETNILVVVTLILSALAIAARKKPHWLDVLRGMTTVFILVVGIGFAVLLSGLEGVALTAVPWDNIVLHYIIPIAVIVDFFLDRPAHRLRFKTGLLWIIYPVLYVVYSLIRGSIVGWYPYPFLNPTISGMGSVLVTVLGLVALGIVLILLVTRMSVRKRR